MTETPFQVIPTDAHSLRLVGELDLATVSVLEDALQAMPHEGTVTLDLSELAFVDSCGVHALARYAQSLNGQRPLILANVPGPVASLFALVEIDKLDTIEIQ